MAEYEIQVPDAMLLAREGICSVPETRPTRNSGPASEEIGGLPPNWIFERAFSAATVESDQLNLLGKEAGLAQPLIDTRRTYFHPAWIKGHQSSVQEALGQFSRLLDQREVRRVLDITAVRMPRLAVAFAAAELSCRAILWPQDVPNNVGFPLASFLEPSDVVRARIEYPQANLREIDWGLRKSRQRPDSLAQHILPAVARRLANEDGHPKGRHSKPINFGV